jgi:hypothetical protein
VKGTSGNRKMKLLVVCSALLLLATAVGTAAAGGLNGVSGGSASPVPSPLRWEGLETAGVFGAMILARMVSFLGFARNEIAYLYLSLQSVESAALAVFGVLFLAVAALVRRVPTKA